MAHTFVKDVMISEVATLDSSSMIKETAKLMDEKDIGCIIVTKDQLPVGIITERDFVKRIASKEKPLTSSLEEVMSTPLISIDPDEYPSGAVLDFRVQALIGYYRPVGRNAVIWGWDFIGQKSDWSEIQTFSLSETTFEVIPEFPSWIIIPMFLTATMIGILVRKRIVRT